MPTPHEVITAALAVPLPCPVCGSLETCRCVRPDDYSPTSTRATLIEAALRESGHLPTEETTDDLAAVEQAAQYVAERSGHPRYTGDDDEWRKLLESVPDVEVAHHQALHGLPPRDDELHAAYELLLWAHRTNLIGQGRQA